MKCYKIALVLTPLTSISSALSIYDIFIYINTISNDYKIEIDFLNTEKNDYYKNSIHIKSINLFEQKKIYDFIFFPPLQEINAMHLTPNKHLIHWLKQYSFQHNTILCASCSNVYTFAYAGLLNYKHATTHWSLEDDFKSKFTDITLDIHKLIVDENNILTSGGGYSYIDLSFYIINKFISHELAYKIAKDLVVDMGRISQAYFKTLPLQLKHNDQEIEDLLNWIDTNIQRNISVKDLANYLSISQKTLIRKFKFTTGLLPKNYLMQLKVEKAKYLLVNGNLSFQNITELLGYNNPSTFRQLFKKYTSLTPQEYRNKFINLQPRNVAE